MYYMSKSIKNWLEVDKRVKNGPLKKTRIEDIMLKNI